MMSQYVQRCQFWNTSNLQWRKHAAWSLFRISNLQNKRPFHFQNGDLHTRLESSRLIELEFIGLLNGSIWTIPQNRKRKLKWEKQKDWRFSKWFIRQIFPIRNSTSFISNCKTVHLLGCSILTFHVINFSRTYDQLACWVTY